MTSLFRNRTAQSHILWYLFYLVILAVIFGSLALFGTQLQAVQSNAGTLPSKIAFEQAQHYIKQLGQTSSPGLSNESLENIFSTKRDIALRVDQANKSYYYRPTAYERMRARAPVAFALYTTTIDLPGGKTTITLVSEQ